MHWGVFCAVLACVAAVPSLGAQVASPESYDLILDINVTSSTFSGTVNITGQVSALTDTLVLQTSGLSIDSVEVEQSSQAVENSTVDNDAETLTISLNSSLLVTASFVLSISFSGSLSSNQSGLYSFVDNKQEYLVTNLYPAYARTLFPCFDDPNAKAKFNLTVSTAMSSDVQIISNTEATSQSTVDGVTTTVFNETAAIPPSSLFFIVGPLNSYYSTGTTTIWMAESLNGQQLNSDLFTALSDNEVFTEFHELDDMPKLDIIVVPELKNRSYSGYGLVVYRADAVMIDLTKSTTALIRESTVTILEALFKIFYGTLTSPASWAENYISDSVATYLSYAAMSSFDSSTSLEPSRALDYFFADVSSQALDLCTTSTAVVSNTTLNTSSDIEAFVNGPSMIKGAAILQMVSSLVPNMTEGLLTCFTNTSELTTGISSADFLECLNTFWSSTSYNLTTIIGPWMSDGGCPLIVTERIDSAVYLVQEQIAETSSVESSADTTSSSLSVPVTSLSNATGYDDSEIVYTTSDSNSPTELAAVIGSTNWFVVDVDGQGYYRTQYDTTSWSLLTGSLADNISVVSSATRAKILSDSFFVAQEIDHTFYETLPDSISFLASERDLAPWQITIEQWRRLWNWIYHTGTPSISSWEQDISLNFTNYTNGLMLDTFVELGITDLDSDSLDTKTLRNEIVGAICDFGYTLCINSTQSAFQNWLDNTQKPSSDMLPVIVCNGLKSSEYDVPVRWLGIFNILSPVNHIDENIRNVLYKTLACVSPSNTTTGVSNSTNEYLSIVLLNSRSNFPIDDVPMAFKAIYERPEHTTQALEFFLTNQPDNLRDDLVESTQVSMMNDLAQYLTLDSQATLLSTFVTNSTANTTDSFLTAVEAAQTTLETKITWIKAVQSYLHAGLDSDYTPSVTTATSATSTASTASTAASTAATTEEPSGAGTYAPCIALLFVTLFAFIF